MMAAQVVPQPQLPLSQLFRYCAENEPTTSPDHVVLEGGRRDDMIIVSMSFQTWGVDDKALRIMTKSSGPTVDSRSIMLQLSKIRDK